MAAHVTRGLLLLALLPAPARAQDLDLAHAPFVVSRAVEHFTSRSPREGVLNVHLVGGLEDHPRKCGEVCSRCPRR
jgi:hypothetical protein